MDNSLLSLNQKGVLSQFESAEQLSVSDICEKLHLPRPTAKQTLMRLVKIGVLRREGLGRGAYYQLNSEDVILDQFGNQLITVHKGLPAFRQMFESLQKQLKKGDFYWSFAFKNEYFDPSLGEFLLNFHQELTHKDVEDRSIANQDVHDLISQTYRNIPDLQLRFTSQDVPIGMSILKDRVVNLIWGKQPMAIIIKSSLIVEHYRNFFLSVWDKSSSNRDGSFLKKPGNTPLVIPNNKLHGVKNLFVKDETHNPTHTFKDRLAYEMIRPMLERIEKGEEVKPITFGSISYGNTAKAMGHYVSRLNALYGKEIARAVAFVPPSLLAKEFGPDTENHRVRASRIVDDLKKSCTILPIDLKKQVYRSKDLENIARKHDAVIGEFVDITEGLDRLAYVHIIIEAIEHQLQAAPDYVIVPFGAGILCNEIIDYVHDRKLHTKVIPVSSGDPQTIAVMLYGPIWVDVDSLAKNGQGLTRHDPIDRTGRKRKPYIVYNIKDDDILEAMNMLSENGVSAEPSGASSVAILKHLKKIDPKFNPEKDTVLAINTGNGLLNYV
ncbi:MAG: pyridoxal-phosphate dependent enzyme [Candidatus Berkelbacteria bacterium]|nr:pyridoxal-phosphate dependent enzyme [Candidatus Berkelbacteria bacterium]MCR4308214.1 pyridoxal-phosphate dependent enzyme [Candidatus Berkelbacteria bacterium]